jgi:Nuclear transport factor 2 (NTF2) domain.
MNREDLEDWLANYRQAWTTDDPDDVGALFTDDATYSPWPYATPWAGREQIVSKWVERGDSKRPWTFEHRIVAIDSDLGVVEGVTGYPAHENDEETEFRNLWLVRLTPDGRASQFAEWWAEREKPA